MLQTSTKIPHLTFNKSEEKYTFLFVNTNLLIANEIKAPKLETEFKSAKYFYFMFFLAAFSFSSLLYFLFFFFLVFVLWMIVDVLLEKEQEKRINQKEIHIHANNHA